MEWLVLRVTPEQTGDCWIHDLRVFSCLLLIPINSVPSNHIKGSFYWSTHSFVFLNPVNFSLRWISPYESPFWKSSVGSDFLFNRYEIEPVSLEGFCWSSYLSDSVSNGDSLVIRLVCLLLRGQLPPLSLLCPLVYNTLLSIQSVCITSLLFPIPFLPWPSWVWSLT